jgi:hypothetical protein
MRTKGYWPTASRDALVMSFITRLPDGRFMNVTKSVDSHPDYVQAKGDVRMLAHIAGQIIGPHPTNPKYCRCIQVVDGDLGGWLPQNIVSLVTTQAFPISMRRANSQLKKIPIHKTISTLIEDSEGKRQIQKTTPQKMVQKQSFLYKFLEYLKDKQPLMVLAILFAILFRK